MYHFRLFACIFVCILLTSNVFAQAESDISASSGATTNRAVMQPDQQPSFLGNWNKFLAKNLQYPDKCQEMRQEGKTMLQFTVLETGLIDDIRIIQSSGYKLLDEEAIRVARIMQGKVYWKPGRKNGTEIRAFFKVPVTFRLEQEG
jgi:TonB family protein